MKKILSVILVLSMVLALGTVAFAANPTELEVGKATAFSFNVPTANGVTISDINGILTFGMPVVGEDTIAINVTAPAGTAGMITKIVVRASDANKTVLYETGYISIKNPAGTGNGSVGQETGLLKVGNTYAFTFNVPTDKGVVITDSNDILEIGDPVVTSGSISVNIRVPAIASGKVTKIVIRANDTAKTVLYEGYVSVAVSNTTVTPPAPSAPTTPTTPSTPTQKPNTNTGATSAAAAVVAVAVMGMAAVVTKKITK